MKKVLIDSSSWVSYFLGVNSKTFIYQQVTDIIKVSDIILVPDIIYAEVLNVLNRLGYTENSLEEVKKSFETKQYLKYSQPYHFWFTTLEFYLKRVKLNTQDLIVLANTFEHWPCELITGDKKLKEMFYLLKPLYEKNS